MSYKGNLLAWADQHSPDFCLHKQNPLDRLADCWEAQDNWGLWSVAQTGVCVCHVVADPGTGKTASVGTLAHLLNQAIGSGSIQRFSRPLGFLRIMPNTRIPEDFSGFPVKTVLPSGREVMAKLEDVQLALGEETPHVILMDELADVHESIQAAMLGYMDRRHGESILIGCSNPQDTATNPTPLRPAFVSRMWNGTWCQGPTHWAQRGSVVQSLPDGTWEEVFPPLPVPILPDGWEASRGTWNALLANFVSAFPREKELDPERDRYHSPGEYSNSCPKNTEDQSQPFPCDRSRHLCAFGMAAGTAIGANPQTMRDISSGFLGKKASEAFWTFIDRLDIQDGQEILMDPDCLREPKDPMSAHLALTGAISAWRRLGDEVLWTNMIRVLAAFHQFCPDLAQCFFPAVLHAQSGGQVLPTLPPVIEMAKVAQAVNKAVQEARHAS